MVRSRKGQTGSNAAGAASLVALIALAIIGYIILLPPDVREEILDGNGSINDDDNNDPSDLARTLVSDDIGSLDRIGQDEFEHHLSAVNLYTTTSATVLYETDSVYVKYGMFDKSFKKVEFSLDDIDNLDNPLLSFRTEKAGGVLTIKLNGRDVIIAEVSDYPAPIKLEPSWLNYDNVLEFEVSDVGWSFWKTNEYLIEDLKITGDMTDVSQQESSSTFFVTKEEKDNLESADFKFYPDCRISDVGRLEIYLNNQKIFNSVPDCGSVNKIELSPGHIDEGLNSVEFRTQDGYYLIDQIVVNTELSDITYPIYYFEISDKDYEEIRDDELEVNMTFRFVDDVELKSATIYINGRRLAMNSRDAFYSRDITSYVEEGNNAVKVEPEKDNLDIIEFKIILQEVDD